MKNSNDTIGNQTLDLPTCSAVPQPTALLCTPVLKCILSKSLPSVTLQQKISVRFQPASVNLPPPLGVTNSVEEVLYH
jgi:hypothetical protein